MAVQTGIGLSKLVFIVGAGYTGTILIKNNKLSELLGELQNLVKGLESSGDSANADTDPIAAQVRWLAQEVRQLANTRQITVLNGGSGGTDLSPLILPAATLGALGYGYMWWKGLSISDLMYVTKRNMAAAVANLNENLKGVAESVEKGRKHLLQRLQNLDGKIDEQREMSKLIMNEVQDARGEFMKAEYFLKDVSQSVDRLESRIDMLDEKQTLALMGINHLLKHADGKSTKAALTHFSQEFRAAGKSRGFLPYSDNLGLQGLVTLITEAKTEDAPRTRNVMLISEGKTEDAPQTRNYMRSTSAKVAKF